MGKAQILQDSIQINSSLDKIWDVLTNPEITPIYMYTCAVISDWKIGGDVLWKGIHDDVIYVKGKLVEFEVKKKFVYTVFDPNSTIEDIPENYLTVSCYLEVDGESTILKVTQGDYSKVANGQSRYDEAAAAGGWQSVLEKIKEIAEQN